MLTVVLASLQYLTNFFSYGQLSVLKYPTFHIRKVRCNWKMIEVTAAILEDGNKIMIARRGKGKHLAGFWEFPGGKIEQDETPEICLIRELKEEFEIDVSIGSYIGESVFKYPEKTIKLIGNLTDFSNRYG